MNDEDKMALALEWYGGQVTMSLLVLLLCGLFGFSFVKTVDPYDIKWCVALFLTLTLLSVLWLGVFQIDDGQKNLTASLVFMVIVHFLSQVIILYPVSKLMFLLLSTKMAIPILILLYVILNSRFLLRVHRYKTYAFSIIDDGRIFMKENAPSGHLEIRINPLVKSPFEYKGSSEERERLERKTRLILGIMVPTTVSFSALFNDLAWLIVCSVMFTFLSWFVCWCLTISFFDLMAVIELKKLKNQAGTHPMT